MHALGGRRAVIVTAVVATLLGTALWLHIGYEPDAGSHRIALTLPAGSEQHPPPRIKLHLGHGVVARVEQVDAHRFDWSDDGELSAPIEGGTATYSGPVGSAVHVEWIGGSGHTPLAVRVDGGRPTIVDLTPDGHGVHEIAFDLSLPRSSWLLLAILIVWMALPAHALARRLDGRTLRSASRSTGRLSGRSTSMAGPIALAIGGAALIVWGLPIEGARAQVVEVEVEAIGPSPLGSQGAETWVRIATPGGDKPLSTQLSHPRWVGRDQYVVGSPGAGPLRARVNVGPDDRLEFASISHSGLARVTIDGTPTVIDTFARPEPIEFGRFARGPAALLAPAAWLLTFLALAAGLLLLVLAIDARTGRRIDDEPATRTPGVGMSLPYWVLPQLVWTTALVVLWPGLMSPDSLSQWRELESGELSDWHPYTTTVVIGLLRLIVDSPWLPILLTVTAASLTLGALARLAATNGCPRPIVITSLLAASASPALLLLGVVLWKDVIMGVALLATTLAVWHLLDDRRWLERRRNVVMTVAALSMVWLSRHNGWPIVIALLAILTVFRPKLRRPLAGVAAAVLAIALTIEVPLARALDVEPNPTGGIAFLQRISAHVNAGTRLDDADRAMLEELRPLDEPWPYDCATVQPTWAGPGSIPLSSYRGRESELLRLALRLTLRNPGVEIDHLRCSSRLIWQLSDQDSTTFLVENGGGDAIRDTIPTWFTDSPMEAYPSRRLASRSLGWLLGLPSPLLRPGMYLLPFALVTAAAAVRRRSIDPLLVAAPAALQAMSMAPFVLVQDTRFLFGSMLIAAFFIPLLATVDRGDGSATPLSWSARPTATEPTEEEASCMSLIDERADPTKVTTSG